MKKLILILTFCVSNLTFAQNFYVAANGNNSPPYTNWVTAATNIHDAVSLALSGDSVIVSNGAYVLSSQIEITNAIIFKSLSGREETVLNASSNCRAFYVSANAVIDGFTVSNGNSYVYTSTKNKGGAFWLDDFGSVINCSFINCRGKLGGAAFVSGETLISNCFFKGNIGSTEGGGAVYTYHLNSFAKILDSEFDDNLCYGWGGGAIVAYQNTFISGCKIYDNISQSHGGGVFLKDSAKIENSLIYGNSAIEDGGYGGGIIIYWDGPVVSNCVISNNYAGAVGGGIACLYDGIVENCLISDNLAYQGGGIGSPSHNLFDGAVINNCVISNNTAYFGGGYLSDWKGILKNCLITGNNAITNGGGAELLNAGGMINCTVTKNTAAPGWADGVYLFKYPDYEGPGGFISNSIIYYNDDINYQIVNNSHSIDFTCSYPMPTGAGNITNAPLFVNMASDDFKLLPNSPCINQGANESWMTNATDLDGNARILDGIVDMGAYEKALALWCDFTADNVTILPGDEVIFTANVQGSNSAGIFYYWNFIPPGQNLNQVTNIYPDLGFYDVALTVSNSISETYSRTKQNYIEVVPEPAMLWMIALCALFRWLKD